MRPWSRPAPGVGQGGDSYLASVSDLVSALIFVFIIMLAVFAYQLANVTEGLTAADETRRQMLQAIADRLQTVGIRVQVLHEQGVLRLSDNAINFPSGGEPVAGHHAKRRTLARPSPSSCMTTCFGTGAGTGGENGDALARGRPGHL